MKGSGFFSSCLSLQVKHHSQLSFRQVFIRINKVDLTRMGYYNPNMIQIPVESFTYKNQSDDIPGQESIRYSKWNKDSPNHDFTKYIDKECTTMYDAFRYGAAKSKGGICMGWRNSQTHFSYRFFF